VNKEGGGVLPNSAAALENAVRKAWKINKDLCARRRLNLAAYLTNRASEQRKLLSAFYVEQDFDRLCTDGCDLRVISLLAESLTIAKKRSDSMSTTLGTPREQRRAVRTLEKSIDLVLSHQCTSKSIYALVTGLTNARDLDQLLTSLVGLAHLFHLSLGMREKIGDLTVVDVMNFLAIT